MKKHERARILAIVVTPHLYGTTMIPDKPNGMLLRFAEEGKLPTDKEIKWLKRQIDLQTYPKLFGGGGG